MCASFFLHRALSIQLFQREQRAVEVERISLLREQAIVGLPTVACSSGKNYCALCWMKNCICKELYDTS